MYKYKRYSKSITGQHTQQQKIHTRGDTVPASKVNDLILKKKKRQIIEKLYYNHYLISCFQMISILVLLMAAFVAADEPMTVLSEPAESVSVVHCDASTICPDGTTCCLSPYGVWFCCPFSMVSESVKCLIVLLYSIKLSFMFNLCSFFHSFRVSAAEMEFIAVVMVITAIRHRPIV